MSNKLTFALVGNPNCGKTTIFNALTGSKQHVGNWPGVTVEKKEGKLVYNTEEITVVDLPGTYSMGAYSEDEVVARDFILEGNPDVVINVVDSTNIERNLYLTTQLLEMGANVVIALNMIDEAEKKDIDINVVKLSKELGVPIITTVGNKDTGIQDLIKCAIDTAKEKTDKFFKIDYGKEIEKEINLLKGELKNSTILIPYSKEWVAIKLLENDEHMFKKIYKNSGGEKIVSLIKESVQRLTNEIGYEPESYIIDKRYDFISDVTNTAVKKKNKNELTISDKIDRVVTNKYFGIPIFAIIMFLMYQATMTLGDGTLGELVGGAFESLGEMAEGALEGSPELLSSFIVDGLIGGMGAVFEFIPLLFILYFFISLLEDSGYMARAAYVMDRFMSSIGLHGKTAVSLIIGSGCNVAGIMSTRTLESKKDRMIAILINPFMSCGAKLPVYAVFIGTFFANKKIGIFSASGFMVFILYTIGVMVAILMGKIFSKTLLKGEQSYFVMELPPYRIPTLKGVLIHMWEKSEAFIKKAGTVIFSIVVLVWALSVLPIGVEPGSENSVIGIIGRIVAPIFKPAGFGNWQSGVALVTGLGAKEAVVATMATIYGVAEEGPEMLAAVRSTFTPLSAVSFMIFTLLYSPCAAAIGAVKRETNSSKWAWFTVAYTTGVAWIVAVLVYQVGKLLGFS